MNQKQKKQIYGKVCNNLHSMFGIERNRGLKLSTTRLKTWIQHIIRYILWTKYDFSAKDIMCFAGVKHKNSISDSLKRVADVIEVRDQGFYPDLVKVQEIYPVLTTCYARYRIRKNHRLRHNIKELETNLTKGEEIMNGRTRL